MNESAAGPRILHRFALAWEVVTSGLQEIWAHKLRSVLTLTLLMLGVFALVVMSSLLTGILDKIGTGFSGMSWDGTLMVAPRSPETTEEQKRFAMSTGLRLEDIPRLAIPNDKIEAFMPRASRQVSVRMPSGPERAFVAGITPPYLPTMNRRIASGRGLTEDDARRRSAVAVLGSTMASKFLGGADPVGRDVMVDGLPFRVVGVLAPLMIFNEDTYVDANGILVPLEAYMDRLEPTHQLSQIGVKLKATRDAREISAMMLGRARSAHHGIEDVEVVDLDAEAARAYQNFLGQMRKALGASDPEIFVQFLLEAAVLAALGALVGTFAGAVVCRLLSPMFPWGLVVNPLGLATAWATALLLSLVFGLYPAFRAMALSPMEAMR
jgi:putative ABC transport system permease protein